MIICVIEIVTGETVVGIGTIEEIVCLRTIGTILTIVCVETIVTIYPHITVLRIFHITTVYTGLIEIHTIGIIATHSIGGIEDQIRIFAPTYPIHIITVLRSSS